MCEFSNTAYFISALFFIIMIGIDFIYVNHSKENNIKSAFIWSLLWIILSCLFGLSIFYYLQYVGCNKSVAYNLTGQFFTGYILEKTLAIDNIFVFIMVFVFFKIPIHLQKKILLYGIIGAIVFRFIFIYFGVLLIAKFSWLMYIFAVILLYSAIKIFFTNDDNKIQDNKIYQWTAKVMPISKDFKDEKFFIKEDNKIKATPLFVALIIIEASDIIFSLDSIPAIFAISNDIFIIFTSNILAILGLRSMFFLLAWVIEKFIYLKYAIAFILVFISIKILIHSFVEIPILISLSVISVSVLCAIIISYFKINYEKVH